LGFCITTENYKHQAQLIIQNRSTQSLPKPYDIAPHTFEFQTKLLIQKLAQID
jgi:hypothetical protein